MVQSFSGGSTKRLASAGAVMATLRNEGHSCGQWCRAAGYNCLPYHGEAPAVRSSEIPGGQEWNGRLSLGQVSPAVSSVVGERP